MRIGVCLASHGLIAMPAAISASIMQCQQRPAAITSAYSMCLISTSPTAAFSSSSGLPHIPIPIRLNCPRVPTSKHCAFKSPPDYNPLHAMPLSSTPAKAQKVPLRPFMVLARLFTKSEAKIKTELDLLKGVAEYEVNQAECGSYLYMLPHVGDQTVFTLLEVYDTHEYMLGAHRDSKPFQNLKKVEQQEDTRLKTTEVTYLTPKGGFLEREQPSKVPLADQYFWIAIMHFTPLTRTQALTAILEHAEYVFEEEKNALSFMVAEDAKDDSTLIVFERYTGEDFFQGVHTSSDSIQALRKKLKPLLIKRTSQGYHAVRGFVSKKEALV